MAWIRRRVRRTGWRNVSDELINGWAGMLFVARADDAVFFRGKLDGTTATAAAAWNIPLGFRCPPVTHNGSYDYGASLAWTEDNNPSVRRLNYYNNRLAVIVYQTSDRLLIADSFLTVNAWPITFPGVAA
jgi:hypothetical protein